MIKKEYRPRLSEAEMSLILGYRDGEVIFTPQEKEGVKNRAKILIFDIETAPIRAHVWGLWKQNVMINQIISEWFMISWSAKWLFDDVVVGDVLTSEEAKNEDDKRISESIWDLLDEADIVIGHNVDKYDIKRLNTRFAVHDMTPPMPYKSIDTLKVAKAQFAFSSNRMDHINDMLGLHRKMETGGFELWEGCLRGDQECLTRMQSYNDQDILISEELYLRMLPWIKSHPNMGLYVENDVSTCPNCSSKELHWTGSTYKTMTNSYDAFRCLSCGNVGRSRKANKKASEQKNLVRSVSTSINNPVSSIKV